MLVVSKVQKFIPKSSGIGNIPTLASTASVGMTSVLGKSPMSMPKADAVSKRQPMSSLVTPVLMPPPTFLYFTSFP